VNYYEHWLGDYRRKTGRLRIAEHGAYRLLLDEYYALEQPLPASVDELYVICGAMDRRDQEAVRKIADAYFPVGPDGLRHNERADEEIARARPRIEAAKLNGRKGGRKKNPTETQQEPSGFPTGTAPEPKANPPATHAGEAFPHTPHKLQNRGVEVMPPTAREQPVDNPANPAISDPENRTANGSGKGDGRGQCWGDPAWWQATAKTVGRPRRPGETDEAWKDGVYAKVHEARAGA